MIVGVSSGIAGNGIPEEILIDRKDPFSLGSAWLVSSVCVSCLGVFFRFVISQCGFTSFPKRALKGGGGNRMEGKTSQCFVTLACRRLFERVSVSGSGPRLSISGL